MREERARDNDSMSRSSCKAMSVSKYAMSSLPSILNCRRRSRIRLDRLPVGLIGNPSLRLAVIHLGNGRSPVVDQLPFLLVRKADGSKIYLPRLASVGKPQDQLREVWPFQQKGNGFGFFDVYPPFVFMLLDYGVGGLVWRQASQWWPMRR